MGANTTKAAATHTKPKTAQHKTAAADLPTLAAPFAALLSPNYYIFAAVFVFKGAGTTGLWLAKNNYSLEVAPVTSRPTYVGILNTSLAFVMLLPVIGGLVVDLASYGVLFALTGMLTLVSVVESAKLDEPRRYEVVTDLHSRGT